MSRDDGEQVSLFEGSPGGAVRDMVVERASSADVEALCSKWHYSGSSGNAAWRYGLWDGLSLVGVVAYNLPTMGVCESVFGAESWRSVVHMGRLVCRDDAPRNSESRLIAGSLRLLVVDQPHVRAVLTYADPLHGHIGTVYQATNALYTGRSWWKRQYLDGDGLLRGTFLNGRFVSKARAIDLGWEQLGGGEKYRYLYLVGSRTQKRDSLRRLRLPVLPYPKLDVAIAAGAPN